MPLPQEGQIVELEVMLKDTNEAAARVGQSAISRLTTRTRELELELGSCQSKTVEAMKAYQKAERRIKELQFQQEEDKKNKERMSELANQLQHKIKTLKNQIQDAEEIAALNLAKFRNAQQELEEVEERSRMAENLLALSRQSAF